MGNASAPLAVCVLLAIASLLLLPSDPVLAGCETRASWIGSDSIESEARRTETLQRLLDCNINLAFLIAPPIGDNYGECQAGEFQAFLDMLVAADIKVHVWVFNMARNGWGTQADFTNPVERAAQAQWAVDLLDAYPVLEGVHLDYIRYDDWGDPDGRLSAVSATVQGIYNAVKSAHAQKLLSAAVFVADPSWGSGAFVPQWFLDWAAANPGSVYEDEWGLRYLPLHMNFQQDPITWLKDGYIDAVCPMQYTNDDSTWEQEVDLWRSFCDWVGVEFSTQVIMGVGWLTEAGHDDWQYDAPAHVRHVQFGQAEGLAGYSIFRIGNPAPEVNDYELISALTIDGPINGDDAPWETPLYPCFLAASLAPPLLEVHPNERGQGYGGGPKLGTQCWTSSGLTGPFYLWKVYQFDGSANLWIQVCGQNFNNLQNASGKGDMLQLKIDGQVPDDVWGIMTGWSGVAQWRGDNEHGDRYTLEFQPTGLSAGQHVLKLAAKETPIIWWVKVADLSGSRTE